MMLPKGAQLRILQPSQDAPALAALVAGLMPYPWTAATFASCAGPEYLGWVVEYGQTLAAVVVARHHSDACELLTVAVAQSLQHQGIAAGLIQQLCASARARGATTLWLEVRASNHPAQSLYQRLGFEQVAVRPDYYPSSDGREDALIMRRSC